MVQYTQSSPGHLNCLPFACFPCSRHCWTVCLDVICANVQTETARTQKQSPQTWHFCKHFKQLIKLWTFCYKVADTVKHICQGNVFVFFFLEVSELYYIWEINIKTENKGSNLSRTPFTSFPSGFHICILCSNVSKSFKNTFPQNV